MLDNKNRTKYLLVCYGLDYAKRREASNIYTHTRWTWLRNCSHPTRSAHSHQRIFNPHNSLFWPFYLDPKYVNVPINSKRVGRSVETKRIHHLILTNLVQFLTTNTSVLVLKKNVTTYKERDLTGKQLIGKTKVVSIGHGTSFASSIREN